MKSLIMLAILLFASTAFATPFLVSDPSTEAIGLQFEILNKNGAVIYSGDNQPDGSISVDLKDIAIGDYEVTGRYVQTHMWGTSYSEPSNPCIFTRPASTFSRNPVGLKLSK